MNLPNNNPTESQKHRVFSSVVTLQTNTTFCSAFLSVQTLFYLLSTLSVSGGVVIFEQGRKGRNQKSSKPLLVNVNNLAGLDGLNYVSVSEQCESWQRVPDSKSKYTGQSEPIAYFWGRGFIPETWQSVFKRRETAVLNKVKIYIKIYIYILTHVKLCPINTIKPRGKQTNSEPPL